jgi:hypothetical protein
MKHPLFLNRIRSVKGVYSIDSTALSVCRNPHISTRRAAKGYALRGKTGYLPILPLLERDIPGEESGPVIRGNGIRDSLKQRFQVF